MTANCAHCDSTFHKTWTATKMVPRPSKASAAPDQAAKSTSAGRGASTCHSPAMAAAGASARSTRSPTISASGAR